MLNIDFEAVGNWAERRNLAYAGYTDLAQKAEVYQLMLECVEKVNADLAADTLLAGSQISRFLVLHKELDADDGELTRTNKVRRGFIAEKYAVLVDCLVPRLGTSSSLKQRSSLKMAVLAVSAPHLRLMDARDICACGACRMSKRIGDVILDVRNISLSFGGVKALSDISFNVREHEIRAIIGPNGAGKSSMLNCINGVYTPQQGHNHVPWSNLQPHGHATKWQSWAWRALSRTWPCSRA
jgi:ABC-type glutathione transport system ATPase component